MPSSTPRIRWTPTTGNRPGRAWARTLEFLRTRLACARVLSIAVADMDSKVRSSLTRYRVMAYVVGVMLLVLVLVAMPLKYIGGNDAPVAVVGPMHGFLYAVYLLTVLDLGTKSLWSFRRTVLIMLAGTIPFVSFVAERKVTKRVHSALAA